MNEEPAQRSIYTNNEFYVLFPTFAALFTSDKQVSDRTNKRMF